MKTTVSKSMTTQSRAETRGRTRSDVTCRVITSQLERELALQVIEEVYRGEKHWVRDADAVFPAEDLAHPGIAWFLALEDGVPVGTARVLYDLPVELYANYGFDLIDASLDVERFLSENKVAEIGRFAVPARSRSSFLIAAALMRATTVETVRRGFSHYVTDVFENEPNSPLGFHQRVLGFRTVATHSTGELNHEGRRITMVLDIPEALQRLREKNAWIYRYVMLGDDDGRLEALHVATA